MRRLSGTKFAERKVLSQYYILWQKGETSRAKFLRGLKVDESDEGLLLLKITSRKENFLSRTRLGIRNSLCKRQRIIEIKWLQRVKDTSSIGND